MLEMAIYMYFFKENIVCAKINDNASLNKDFAHTSLSAAVTYIAL